MVAAVNDTRDELVNLRLEGWARWSKLDAVRAWPRRTVLGRVIDQGWAAGEAGGAREMPEDVAQVDSAIAKLGAIDRKVLVTFYTEWEPVNVMARRCRMREQQFRNVLKRAKWRVRLYLE